MKYILWAVISGTIHASYMGEFENMQACQEAIKQRFLLNIDPGARDMPEVQKAIETTLLHQREYICVPNSSQ